MTLWIVLRRFAVLAILAVPALLVGLGCSRDAAETDPFGRIRAGWSRDKLVAVVGEPATIHSPPFEGRDARECRDAASVELGFKPGASREVLVYLDQNDRVLCVIQELHLMAQ